MTANQDRDYHAGGIPAPAGTLSVVIQAGGESRRMGRDKALVPFLGRPMIERIIERVSPVADEVVITSNAPAALAYLGLPIFADVTKRRGALNGLLTALSVARCEFVAVVACDMVFASSGLLAAEFDALLTGGADVAVPVTGHGFEPFHAVYRKDTCLAAVLRAVERGDAKAGVWYPEVKVVQFDRESLDAIGLDGPVFVNANTPEELAAAEVLALQHGPRDVPGADPAGTVRFDPLGAMADAGRDIFGVAGFVEPA